MRDRVAQHADQLESGGLGAVAEPGAARLLGGRIGHSREMGILAEPANISGVVLACPDPSTRSGCARPNSPTTTRRSRAGLFGTLGGVGAWRNATGTMRLKKKQTPGLQKSGRFSVIYWPIYTYFSPAGSWLSFSKRLRIRVRRRDNRRICLFALDGAKSWRYRFISRRTAWRAASTAVASAAEVGAMPHWRAGGTGI